MFERIPMTYVEFNLIRVISAGIITAAISTAYSSFAYLLHGPLLNANIWISLRHRPLKHCRLIVLQATHLRLLNNVMGSHGNSLFPVSTTLISTF